MPMSNEKQVSIKYHVSQPSITDVEKNEVNKVLESGMISSVGPVVGQFETLFAEKHGAKHGIACSSGTTALILALRAIGIKEGDEVIVPNFTMIATAWAVTIAGGTPKFVDCWTDNNINVDKIEEAITPLTKAIIPVHIYGRRANMEAINKIAHDYNLMVIEDSAEAHGVPISGDIACFSLYANKIITSGEGGVCVTNDPRLAEQMRHLRGMAFSPDHNFLHKKLAYNFRMTSLQAAFALAQTTRLDEILAKRKLIESWYNAGLSKIPRLSERLDVLITGADCGAGRFADRNVLWMYDIRVSKFVRDELVAFLASKGIETRVYFKPMTIQPMYKDGMGEYTVAFKYSMEGLYLPTYTDMTEDDVNYITSQVVSFYASKENQDAEKGVGSPDAPGASLQKGP